MMIKDPEPVLETEENLPEVEAISRENKTPTYNIWFLC